MAIELRILSGARAGQTQSFTQRRIVAGRDPSCDLCFDMTRDLDVSTRHAELRERGGAAGGSWFVRDSGSTNGTYVNQVRLEAGAVRPLRSGDVIGFGAHGPTVSVEIARAVPKTVISRLPTGERIAIAVREQTRGLRLALALALVVIGALVAGIAWSNHRDAKARTAELTRLGAAYADATHQLEAALATTNDTALINALQRRNDSLLTAARATHDAQDVSTVRGALTRGHDVTRALAAMDLPALRAANNAAVVLITSVVDSQTYEATGFAVSKSGLVVTNRHAVGDSGRRVSSIEVTFADTRTAHRAHIVRFAQDPSVDLALLQIDDRAGGGESYPTVRGIADSLDLPVGSPIVTLGFPLGTDSPMDGHAATTTLTTGTISNSAADVLRIDSFASRGSSGSPVLDGHGHVVGVVSGTEGRIMYAVPASRIAAMVGRSR